MSGEQRSLRDLAEDIEAVITEISKKVKKKTGIKLIQEIRIIGEAK